MIIVAGGSGTRLKSNIPKQFLKLGSKPIICHTIDAFLAWDSKASLILALPKDHFSLWENIKAKYYPNIPIVTSEGGSTRFHSVKNALKNIDSNEGLVAVHDAVRPFINNELIDRIFKKAESLKAAIPVMPLKESLRQIVNEKFIAEKRENFVSVQTPQAFHISILQNAYSVEFKSEFTDDASVVEFSGVPVVHCEGDYSNIKITTREDLAFANWQVSA